MRKWGGGQCDATVTSGVFPRAIGILRQGFIIQTPTMRLKIPKGTIVKMHRINNPTIVFVDFREIRLFKVGSRWYAEIYNTTHLVVFNPKKQPPYPISYFK